MKLRPFELALVIIFGGMALAALVVLKLYQPESKDSETVVQIGVVEIWGTFPAEGITGLIQKIAQTDKQFANVSYKSIPQEEFSDTLTNALADGQGPDVVLISHEHLTEVRKRILPFSYERFPLRDLKNNYIDGAEIFALQDGIYGYPILVDPLMMYWNRNILSTEGYLAAPNTWESLVNDMFPKLIRRDFDRTVTRSVVAMGEYGNVHNAFGLVSALLIQQGSKGVTDSAEGEYVIRLSQSDAGNDPLRATADFYTRFSKPSNTLYSWNRAFGEDRQQFLAEDLAFYFGFASEARELERANPNLNFDIAEIPQGEAASTRRTYGRFYALSLLKSSDNVAGATAVMSVLASATNVTELAGSAGMVPAYRSLVTGGSNDTYGRVSYQSAGIAHGWLNPELQTADEYFEIMMRDINENRREVSSATSDLLVKLRNAY